MNGTALLLDLEGTVIESWRQPDWLYGHITAIGNLARAHAAQGLVRLGLMSWAVRDDAELSEFRGRLAGPLEQRLGFRFDPRLTRPMNQWAKLIHEDSWPLLAPATVFQVFDKPSILFWLRRAPHSVLPGRVILIDDDVPDGDNIISQHRVITLRKVSELPGQDFDRDRGNLAYSQTGTKGQH